MTDGSYLRVTTRDHGRAASAQTTIRLEIAILCCKRAGRNGRLRKPRPGGTGEESAWPGRTWGGRRWTQSTCHRKSTSPSRAWPVSTTRFSVARTISRPTGRWPSKRLRQWETRGRARGSIARPVGLILNAVIHHVLDEEGPFRIVDRCKRVMAPGSYMQLTHFVDASAQARANEEVLRRGLGRGQTRTREQIARFFDGLDLMPPGLVYLAEWRPDEPVRLPLDPGSMLMLVGVGRKP
jgi:hypothetical protein